MSDAPQAIEQIFGMPKVFKKTKKSEKIYPEDARKYREIIQL